MSNSKPSSDLFNLGKSLNEDEELYFYKYTRRQHISERDNFLELFKLIRKQHQYNEDLLKSSLTDKTWAKRITYSKNELLQYIFDSLMANTSNFSSHHSIHDLLELAKLLKDKSLYKIAVKKLNKAYEIAVRFEKHYVLLEILEAQRKLLKQLPSPDMQKQLDANALEKELVIEKILLEDKYSRLNDKVYLLYRQINVIRDVAKLEELETVMQSPLLQSVESAITFDSKIRFHAIHSLYNQLKADFVNALQHREIVIKLWESNPHQISEMPQAYRSSLANLLTIRHFSGNYEGFEELVTKIEGIRKGSLEEDAFTFKEVYPLKQLYFLNNGRIKDAYDLIPEIKRGLDIYGELISPSRLHSFWYNNTITCFLMGKYHETLQWANFILTPGIDKKVRTDLKDFVSILEIILHYETGKYDLVETKVRSTRDRLAYNNKLHEFENVVLQNIGQMIKNKGNSEKSLKTIENFKRQLNSLATISSKEKLTGLEEIILWVQNK